MKNFEEIENKVYRWGHDRGIYNESNPTAQYVKLKEEGSELLHAINLNNPIAIKDAIGDMLVVLTHIAIMNGLSLTKCYNYAYEQIKDRKGKMVNGIFVKE